MSFMIQIQMNLSAPNRSLLSGVLVRLPILLGMTCVALRFVIAQEAGEPAETLQFLAEVNANVLIINAEPAGEPHVALRYRLYPSHRDLKPGAAAPHFARAVMLFLEKSERERHQWNQFQEAHEAHGEKSNIDEELSPFAVVLTELEKFGHCEDLTWDDRLRDLSGKQHLRQKRGTHVNLRSCCDSQRK
jgi:hypothetical protein